MLAKLNEERVKAGHREFKIDFNRNQVFIRCCVAGLLVSEEFPLSYLILIDNIFPLTGLMYRTIFQ